MKTLRVAVVQITTHPYLKIGARSFSSEPVMADGEPLLSRLSASLDVSEIRHKCQSRYDKFHVSRLRSILTWLSDTWSLAQPTEGHSLSQPNNARSHLVVFPEGSIAHNQLREIIDHFILPAHNHGHDVTVIAGTHTFINTQQGYKEYPREIWHGDNNPYLTPVAGSAFKGPAPWNRCSFFEAAKQQEFYRIVANRDYDIKNVLPILHSDGTVTLRLKELLSPFERTNSSQLFASNSYRDPPRIIRLRPSTSDNNHTIRLLPLVCSEALQIPDNFREPEVVAICSYHDRPDDFEPLVTIAKNNGKLAVAAIDGAYGGSGVFLHSDRRAENWWFGTSNRGRLPCGDAIVLADADLDNLVPQLARWNPTYPSGLFRLADIVPSRISSAEFRISVLMTKLLTALEVPSKAPAVPGVNSSTARGLLGQLLEYPNASPLQLVKIRRLWDLFHSSNLTRLDAEMTCNDCKISALSNGQQGIQP